MSGLRKSRDRCAVFDSSCFDFGARASNHIRKFLRSSKLLHNEKLKLARGEPSVSASTRRRARQVTEKELQKRLALLRSEHRDLDAAIDALAAAGSTDMLQIARLKKRKLRLRDQIAMIEDTLLPDIIA